MDDALDYMKKNNCVTETEEACLKSARDGDIVAMPQTAIKMAHGKTQRYINKISRKNKFATVLLNLLTVASVPIFNLSSLPITPTLFGLTTLLALIGKRASESYSGLAFIGDTSRSHDDWWKIFRLSEVIPYVERQSKELAHHFAEVNFVNDADKRVRSGNRISYTELGKLINIDDHKFKDACHRLAITVLQAKAMVAQAKGLIKQYPIATYDVFDLQKSTHDKALDSILRYQATGQWHTSQSNPHIDIGTETKDVSEPNPLTRLFNFYREGLRDNWRVFTTKPTPADLLPAVQEDFVVALAGTDGLKEMIAAYDDRALTPPTELQKFWPLDLPALDRA